MGLSRRRAAVLAAVARPLQASPVESLEGRLLLSATARGALVKIGTTLAADYQQAGVTASAYAVTAAAAATVPATVAVEAYAAPGGTAALARAERRLGAVGVVADGRAVDARVPVGALAGLAAVKSLRFARPDTSVTDAGAATSQGDTADRAVVARSMYGVTGSGVTVGILSDSFNDSGDADTYATDVASGDLPAGVQVLAEDPTAGTDEGRAMAQVVYDSAPGAGLAFATAEGGQATMAANIAALVKAGAKVIVDDVSYLAEPMFEDGPIAQAVAAATAAGVSYFSAAGQTASDAYASTWRSGPTLSPGAIPSAAGAPAFFGGVTYNFAASGPANSLNAFTLGAGQSVTLSFQWDSPYYSVSGGGGSPNQVDAYVLNAAGTQVVGGGVNYDVGGDPVQVFTYTNTSGATATYNLMLASESSAVPGYVKYVDFAGQATGWAYGYNAGSIYGHANAATDGAGSEAVGAAFYQQTPAYGVSPAVLEPASATGTTPVFFSTAGVRLSTPVVRQTPDVVAPDGVDTTFFGQQVDDGDTQPNFFGTSAAAASAAGVAALALSRSPTLTPAGLDSALQSTALDMGTPGVDTQSGYGLIQADAAVAAAIGATTGTVTGTVFQDNNGNAVLDAAEPGEAATVYVDANNNGALDKGEVSTTAAANGTFTLSGVPVGSAVVVRVVPPNGTVATAGTRTVAVTASGTTAGVTLGLFPYVFTGTAGNDSYLLQVDPANKKAVDVVYGGATMTVALSLLPSVVFDTGAGDDTVTVSYLNGAPVPSGGLTFDGGTGTNALVINGSTGGDGATIVSQQTSFDNTTLTALNIASETINGDGGNDAVAVTAAAAAGQTVTFNGGLGTSSFTLRAVLPNNGAGYTYNAGTAAGDVGTLGINVGPYTLSGDPALTSANLTVNVNAAMTLAAAPAGTGVNARHVTALNVGSNGTLTVAAPATHADRTVVVAGSLSVTSGGKLDLAGNDLVVASGTAAAVQAQVALGYAAGAWTGKGITSSAAAADATHLTALGVMAAPAATTFDGVAVAAGAVLVKYTYYGDANLDGVVDAGDYLRTDVGFATALTGWANGDFNYDGVVDGSDYTLIDNAFDTEGTGL